MKFSILPLIAAFALLSCSSDDDAPAGPLVITKADYETNFSPNGTPYTLARVSLDEVTLPTAGQNQTWDFTTLTEVSSETFGGAELRVPNNPNFPEATYVSSAPGFYFLGGAQSPNYTAFRYYDLDDSGIYELGLEQTDAVAIDVPNLGATISFPAQTRPYTSTNNLPTVLFPIEYGDAPVSRNNITYPTDFSVFAPAFGLNNTPGQTVLTTDYTQEVIASGQANFTGIGMKRVLVLKSTSVETENYFLGGAPAPASLLNQFGATNGAVETVLYYRYVTEGLGTVGIITTDDSGTIISARFRRQ